MMPGMDGFEVCKKLRDDGQSIGVLFLTAKDTTEDKINGLTVGGDDYMTKPFSLEELIARLKAILRRTGSTPNTIDEEKILFADLELNEATHEVHRAGIQLEVSKSQILDHVWQYDFRGDAGIVETYISYLRKKVDAIEPPLIHTVRGVGYRLRLPARSA
jgi:two-component system OmpR family response regulator